MRAFDVHVHYPSWFDDHVPRFEQYVAAAEEAGITRAAVFAHPDRFDQVLAAWERYADLVVPVAFLTLDAATPDDLRRLRDQGARGLKAILPSRDYDDPAYLPLYETAASLGLPVLFHTGIVTSGVDYLKRYPKTQQEWEDARAMEARLGGRPYGSGSARMNPVFLDTIAMHLPDLRIIGAHMGYGWYDLAAAVARFRRNVHFDVSGGDVVRRHVLERGLIKREIAVEKVLWGSDTHVDPRRCIGELRAWHAALTDLGLADGEVDLILYGNAARIYGVG